MLAVTSCSLNDTPGAEELDQYVGCYSSPAIQIQLNADAIDVQGERYPFTIERRTVGPVINARINFIINSSDEITAVRYNHDKYYRILWRNGDPSIVITDNSSNVHMITRHKAVCA